MIDYETEMEFDPAAEELLKFLFDNISRHPDTLGNLLIQAIAILGLEEDALVDSIDYLQDVLDKNPAI
jgi:tetrahydromethanopterin S-methyltransferase subunit H